MKRIWLLVALAAIGGLTYGSMRIRRSPLVDVTIATREDVVRILAVTGRMRQRFSNDVVPLVSGTVSALLKREGDAVRRGDVLARIDAQVTEATIAQAHAQLAARRIDVDQRRREFERLRSLNAAGGIADRDVDQARSALESAETVVQQIEALVSESRSRLRDFTLRSPIDGYVLSRPVDPGQNVTPQTVLFELATGTDAEVEAEIDEQYVGELSVGLAATIAPLTGEKKDYPARVILIGRLVSESSGAIPIRLAFAGTTPRLPVGLSVDVNLEIAAHPASITVPRESVGGLGERPFVIVVKNGTTLRQDGWSDTSSQRWTTPRSLTSGTGTLDSYFGFTICSPTSRHSRTSSSPPFRHALTRVRKFVSGPPSCSMPSGCRTEHPSARQNSRAGKSNAWRSHALS